MKAQENLLQPLFLPQRANQRDKGTWGYSAAELAAYEDAETVDGAKLLRRQTTQDELQSKQQISRQK